MNVRVKQGVILTLYTLVLLLAAPFLLYGLYRKKPNKPQFGLRWKEHFGVTPKLETAERPIWIHAVSVGETLAAIPLIKALKKQRPDTLIVVTTTTSTGAEQVKKLGDLVEHRYMPLDFGFAVRGFLKAINPSQLLIIETELWPNTLTTVHHAGIPIFVVNARLSEKSRRNYAKIQPLFDIIAPCLTQVLCQSDSDANRFAALGVAQNSLSVTGSIKFDIDISEEIRTQGKALKAQLSQNDARPIWIAASTHRGEDEILLAAHNVVLEAHPTALLILVPRHPERFNDVYTLTMQQGFHCTRRTSGMLPTQETQVYLADTMGEMLVLLGAADVCFMGGSLLGDKVGGHNMLEPAALGVPIITGPSYFNFADITEALIKHNAIKICDAAEINTTVSRLLSNRAQQHSLILAADTVVKHNRGSLQRTLNSILEVNK
ncbi:3-deoxy-D-manno-octulosonic acid transferase [Vibrio sp. SM6]|uniref:3-deoxy-D-manno-octulosonic acid transferase n=1 Tax=Vibrio agarilyticus TaxID=2726741 RepID=A0A7X8YHB4_9VIBR|nr:lipid IV(A) 3-deoxy-D-manno-octulosonic acid transferase [Vibrio agarilyticus]NLS13554.1 3-deoxy-D-manno-octulosonic acid transferase [Vibrio agarilyticus]